MTDDDPIGAVMRKRVEREGWEPLVRRLMAQRDEWEDACHRAADARDDERTKAVKEFERGYAQAYLDIRGHIGDLHELITKLEVTVENLKASRPHIS